MCFPPTFLDKKRTQPPWQPPSGTVDVGLKMFNSLTRKKVWAQQLGGIIAYRSYESWSQSTALDAHHFKESNFCLLLIPIN
jgi:hypothetical protein